MGKIKMIKIANGKKIANGSFSEWFFSNVEWKKKSKTTNQLNKYQRSE